MWDHVVTVDRRVREFLDLTGVTARGFTVQGSGKATVTTAARYRPGTVFRVAGAGRSAHDVVADRDGRVTVGVDLGPSHRYDQFTPEARLAELAGGYWTTRTVTLTPTDRTAPAPPAKHRPGAQASRGGQGADGRSSAPGGDGERVRDAAPDVGSASGSGPDEVDESPGERVALDRDEVAAAEPVADSNRPWLLPVVAAVLLGAAAPVAWWYRRRSDGPTS